MPVCLYQRRAEVVAVCYPHSHAVKLKHSDASADDAAVVVDIAVVAAAVVAADSGLLDFGSCIVFGQNIDVNSYQNQHFINNASIDLCFNVLLNVFFNIIEEDYHNEYFLTVPCGRDNMY